MGSCRDVLLEDPQSPTTPKEDEGGPGLLGHFVSLGIQVCNTILGNNVYKHDLLWSIWISSVCFSWAPPSSLTRVLAFGACISKGRDSLADLER